MNFDLKRSIEELLSSSEEDEKDDEEDNSDDGEIDEDIIFEQLNMKNEAFIQNFSFDLSNEMNSDENNYNDDNDQNFTKKTYKETLRQLFKTNMNFYETNNLEKWVNVNDLMVNIINKCVLDRSFKMGNYRKHIKKIPISTNILHVNDEFILNLDDGDGGEKNKYKLQFILN